MRFEFTLCGEEDFEALLGLRLLAMRESLERIGRFDPHRARKRFRREFRAEHTRKIFLQDRLVGCAALGPTEDGLKLEHFYLHPEAQGQGLGSVVLEQLLKEADAAGQPVHLNVLRQSDAERFYRRHGFEFVAQDATDTYLKRPVK